MQQLPTTARGHRAALLAAGGLLCLYLALMSGHLFSIDGLVMWRGALALALHHSFTFVPPIWWGDYISTSARGIGASLEYIPSILVFAWLPSYQPAAMTPAYYPRLLYKDVQYPLASPPLWPVSTAATALPLVLTRPLPSAH